MKRMNSLTLNKIVFYLFRTIFRYYPLYDAPCNYPLYGASCNYPSNKVSCDYDKTLLEIVHVLLDTVLFLLISFLTEY